MITYPESTLGCPQRSSYNITKRNATSITPALRGRPRTELLDNYAVYLIALSFDYGIAEYNGWQTFWKALNGGVDWFEMYLTLDIPTGTLMTVHASDAFSAQQTAVDRWIVSLSLEGFVP